MEQQTMLVLRALLDDLCQNISNQRMNISCLKDIFEKFEQNVNKQNSKGYSILTGLDIIPAFLLNNWTFRENIEDNLSNLNELSVMIRDTYTAPSGRQISEEQISAMITLADCQFSIIERFLQHDPIHILLVNNTCSYANALYSINLNPNVVIKDLIVLTYVADNKVYKVCPEFAFLHELGHMVHTRITQKQFVAPRSFDILHPVILKNSHMDTSTRSAKWLKRWFAECFAECFAIAVLHGSPYSYLEFVLNKYL